MLDGDIGGVWFNSQQPAMQPNRVHGNRLVHPPSRKTHASPGAVEQLVRHPTCGRPENTGFPLLPDHDRQFGHELVDSIRTPCASRKHERHQRRQDHLTRRLLLRPHFEQRSKEDVRMFVESADGSDHLVDGPDTVESVVIPPRIRQRPPAKNLKTDVEGSTDKHAFDAEDRSTLDRTPGCTPSVE